MRTYLVSAYTDQIDRKNLVFTCLYEIDLNRTIDSGLSKFEQYKILNVLVGNDKLEYVIRTDSDGSTYYKWKWKGLMSLHGAFYIHNSDNFEIFKMKDDEAALLYYSLNY